MIRVRNIQKGQSLIEVLIAFAIILIVLVSLLKVVTMAIKSHDLAKTSAQATSYAEEGMESLRAYRDAGFSNLWALSTFGGTNYGFGESVPSGTCPTTPNVGEIYIRCVNLAQSNISRVKATVNVTWTDSSGTHTSTQISYFTSWQTGEVFTPSGDFTPPTDPSNLAANVISWQEISLTWNASTDAVGVIGYNVFRGGVRLITLGPVTSYADTGLSASTTYTYYVEAFDAAGNVSGLSNVVSATTLPPPDTTPPTPPTSISAATGSPATSRINLTWSGATDNVGVTGYDIYRGGVWITSVLASPYNDNNLSSGETYTYYVKAFDAAGNYSVPSSNASATTPCHSCTKNSQCNSYPLKQCTGGCCK
ncbi:MAG: prepilin-type N-terminal cleavage/methylation domain-containing protein [bacterium]|nr:prepilin-type N-terminal cleavage/methylation domain-containing protein [bacterium]